MAAHTRFRELVRSRLGFADSDILSPRFDVAFGRAVAGRERISDAWLDAFGAMPTMSPEWQAVIDDVVVGETSFRRHAAWFRRLEKEVLEPLFLARAGSRRLHLWSAGCATGEEPYSLAMALDRLLPDRASWTVTILATDVSASALAHAEAGVYGARALRELDAESRDRWFRRDGDGRYAIVPSIRSMVRFESLNFTESAFPRAPNGDGWDLVVCRNVLMYLDGSWQRTVARRLTHSLADDGWLAVTPAEAAANWFTPLHPHNFPEAIFFARAGRHPPARNPVPVRPTPPRPATAIAVAAPPPTRPVPRSATRAATAPAGPAGAGGGGELLARARALADGGDLAAARRLCRSAAGGEADLFDIRMLLALVCEEMGDDAAALEAIRAAIYLAPSPLAHFRYGMLLARAGEGRRAGRQMHAVIKLLDAEDGRTAGPEGDDAASLRVMAMAVVRDLAGRAADGR